MRGLSLSRSDVERLKVGGVERLKIKGTESLCALRQEGSAI
jgi:hypothetical protein